MTAQVLDRLRNGPPRDQQLEALTAQEQKILELIGEGLTNRQIAERMYLAEKTVKNYVLLAAGQARADQPHPGRDLRHQAPAALRRLPSVQSLSRWRSRRPVTLSTSTVSCAALEPTGHTSGAGAPGVTNPTVACPTMTTLQPSRLSGSYASISNATRLSSHSRASAEYAAVRMWMAPSSRVKLTGTTEGPSGPVHASRPTGSVAASR